MGVERRSGRAEFRAEDAARLGFGDEQAPAVRAAEGEVGRGPPGAGSDALQRLGPRRQAPHRAEAGVRHQEAALRVERQPVRAARPAVQVAEHAGLGDATVRVQRQPPDLVGARHGDQRGAHVRRHNDAVRARHGADQASEAAVRRFQAVDSPGRILQPGLALVGEEQVSVRGEEQIVDTLEAFGARRVQKGSDLPGAQVEQHEAALVVGDEDPPVLVDLQPVRPAVVLRHLLPLALGRDAEDAAEGDVGDIEPALPVEGGAFQEAVRLAPGPVGVAPSGPARAAKAVRQPREDLGLHVAWRGEEGHLGCLRVTASRSGPRRRPCASARPLPSGGG